MQIPLRDDEPPRARRRRDRDRQDRRRCRRSPSSSRPPACRCSPPTSRATCRASAWPGDAGGAGREADDASSAWSSRRPASRSSTCRSAGSGPGVPVRATVSDFGPQLLGQGARRERDPGAEPRARLPLRRREGPAAAGPRRPARAAHLPRLRRRQGRAQGHRRAVASPTVGVLLRELVGLEDGGGSEFFGEPAARHRRPAADSRGRPRGDLVLELPAVQDKPRLFSTALMWLLAELFEQLPEAGDLDKPKLVFFFDEAHLLFDDATEAFLESVAQTVRPDPLQGRRRLLRHAGARRRSRRGARAARQPGPARAAGLHPGRRQGAEGGRRRRTRSPSFYDLEELLTSMGIGEAAVTILSDDGVPTPVVHTQARAPAARIGPADDVAGAARPRRCSPSTARGSTPRARARSWTARMEQAAERRRRPSPKPSPPRRPARRRRRAPAPAGGADALSDFLTSREGKAIQRQVMRGVFGMLGSGSDPHHPHRRADGADRDRRLAAADRPDVRPAGGGSASAGGRGHAD